MIARITTVILALLAAGQADTLRLRNGDTVTGSWLGGSADEVRFMVDDRVQKYPRAEVVSVDFTSIGPSSAIAPAVPVAPVAPPPVLEPNQTGVPFLRGASGFISLERTYAMQVRNNGMYGMGPTVYRIQGPQSPVRVRQGDKIVFVVRLNPRDDPRRFELYQLESRMGYRQTQPSMGGGPPPGIPVTINKISDSTYEITPARQLYPGEYSFSPMGSNENYCFGVSY
jgi:hypothetical protein